MILKKIHRLFAGIAICLLLPLPARALSPDEVAKAILHSSPASEVTQRYIEAAEARAAETTALPDLEIEGEYLAAAGEGANRWGAGVSWGLEWPGVYGARRAESRQRTAAARLAGDAQQIARLGEIRKLLLDYILREKQLEVLRRVDAATDSIFALATVASQAGEITRLDINKLRLEKAETAATMAETEDAQAATVAQLSAIYGRDCRELLGGMACVFPVLDLPESLDAVAAATTSTAVLAAEAEARAAERSGKVAAAEALPGLTIGYRHAFEDNTHFNGASLGIAIPLFSASKKKKTAKSEAVAARIEAEALKAETAASIEGNLTRLQILRKRIGEIEPVVNDTDNLLLLHKAYKGGLLTVLEYLNERNYFTTARLNLLALQYAAATAFVDLNTLTHTQ